MRCKLCNNKTQLVKKSHIIPQFMYDGMFDEKGRISQLDLKNPNREVYIQSGIWEKNILCFKCENEFLSQFEGYAKVVLFGGKYSWGDIPNYSHLNKNLTVANGIDYNKMKLFFLSILWRVHISSRKEFSKVDLGKRGDILRKMLINKDPGKETDYKVIPLIYKVNSIPVKSMIPPKHIPLGEHEYILVHINTLSIFFKISEEPDLEYFESYGLFEDGSMKVIIGDNEPKVIELFQKTTGINFKI